MKLHTLIILGAALIALDALQASYAAGDSYFPAAPDQSVQVTTDLPRATVHNDTLVSAKQPAPATWHEFGAVWHDETLSNQTRAQVTAEAVKAEQEKTRYFAY